MDNIPLDTLVCTVQLIDGKLQNYPWNTPIDRQARKSISPADRVSPIECVIKNTQKGNGGREGGIDGRSIAGNTIKISSVSRRV